MKTKILTDLQSFNSLPFLNLPENILIPGRKSPFIPYFWNLKFVRKIGMDCNGKIQCLLLKISKTQWQK